MWSLYNANLMEIGKWVHGDLYNGRVVRVANSFIFKSPDDMAFPGWRLHPLGHDLAGYWSVAVNGNWRMIFRFDGEDAELVDYLDYH